MQLFKAHLVTIETLKTLFSVDTWWTEQRTTKTTQKAPIIRMTVMVTSVCVSVCYQVRVQAHLCK